MDWIRARRAIFAQGGFVVLICCAAQLSVRAGDTPQPAETESSAIDAWEALAELPIRQQRPAADSTLFEAPLLAARTTTPRVIINPAVPIGDATDDTELTPSESNDGSSAEPPSDDVVSPQEEVRPRRLPPQAVNVIDDSQSALPTVVHRIPSSVQTNANSQEATPPLQPSAVLHPQRGDASPTWPQQRLSPPAGLQPVIFAADQHIRYGFELAGRGAIYSAEKQFVHAITVVAQGLDVKLQSGSHRAALTAGLAALREVDDFTEAATDVTVEIDLADLIARHETPVLKKFDPAGVVPMAAVQTYYGFAKQKLAAASGNVEAASRALYGLGRVHAYMATHPGPRGRFGPAKATVFYRAALDADPDNYRAANELGVLLAKVGQFEEAEALLLKSLTSSPHEATWHNLAIVRQKRGDTQGAMEAWQRRHMAPPAARRAGMPQDDDPVDSSVRWVSHTEFAAQSRITQSGQPMHLNPIPSPKPVVIQTPPKSKKIPLMSRLSGGLFPFGKMRKGNADH